MVYLWLPSASAAVRRVRERVRSGGHRVPEAILRLPGVMLADP
jgi:predicted ABC-type ATPase